MADEVYYSALHWAKKAEASAKQAADLSQTSGKVVQIGFDGTLSNGVLVFKHAPGGTEIPYELVDDVEYEVDLNYANTGSLADNVQMRIKNGSDTINFVSAVHRSSTTPATVGDMKAVMRFDSSTGYRWLFKAAYKITPAGAKVMLLYPVVYNDEAVKALQTADAQNVKLTGDQTIDGYKTFTTRLITKNVGAHQVFTTDKNSEYTIDNVRAYREDGITPWFFVGAQKNPNGNYYQRMGIWNNDNTSFAAINVGFKPDGSLYTEAPTPPTADNSNQIATTAFVKAQIQEVTAAPSNPVSGVLYVIPE